MDKKELEDVERLMAARSHLWMATEEDRRDVYLGLADAVPGLVNHIKEQASKLETAQKEIERLTKLEIPNLKIERDGARYESDMFEDRLAVANLQLSALRPAVLDLLHEIAEDKDGGQNRYEGYGAVFNALHAAYQLNAAQQRSEKRSCASVNGGGIHCQREKDHCGSHFAQGFPGVGDLTWND